MKYLVLFDNYQTISVYEPTHAVGDMWQKEGGMTDHSIGTVQMAAFDSEQEAADYATKNNGYVVIPAVISSKVTIEVAK